VHPPPGDGAARRSPPAPTTELVGLLQCHAVGAVRLGRAFAERHGLHPTDWTALLAVAHGDEVGRSLTPGELGDRLGMSSGATTAVVDRLERAGHVLRVRDERDRRRIALHHAEGADALLAAFFAPLEAAMEALTVGYTARDLAVVRRFLADAVGQVGGRRRPERSDP
jgi:DNA-binding MarR family transcriptional regulator